jgi:hypothetical protein
VVRPAGGNRAFLDGGLTKSLHFTTGLVAALVPAPCGGQRKLPADSMPGPAGLAAGNPFMDVMGNAGHLIASELCPASAA